MSNMTYPLCIVYGMYTVHAQCGQHPMVACIVIICDDENVKDDNIGLGKFDFRK